jgi:hydrogenase 3 maturation protease
VGNPDYGDDGLGIRLAESLAKRFENYPNAPAVIDCGTMPERYVGRLADEGYELIVFLDAVEFGGEPGAVLVANSEEMASRFPQISTHKIALGMLATWVEANGTTKARLIGVQPESLKMGQELTPAVQQTLAVLEELLFDLWLEEMESGKELPPLTN